jgi:hypothetical protein
MSQFVPTYAKDAFDFRNINYVDDTQLKRSTILKLTAVVLVILIIVFRKKIGEILVKAPAGIITDPKQYPNPDIEGYVTADWQNSEMKYLVDTLYNASFSTRCEVYEQINALSNNQIRALNTAFFKKHNKSIAQFMLAQTVSGCIIANSAENLKQRLKNLNLA